MALIEEAFAESVFARIIAESKRLQDQGRRLVGFQGEHGAYSEIAARSLAPGGAFIPCAGFADVFKGVEDGSFDLGVVPVENSLEGAVTQVNDLLTRTPLKVVAEAILPVHHCLLASGHTTYRDIREVYSHPQALGQCRGFLERNKLSPVPYYDTAGAARMLGRDKPWAAAIASPLCAQLYGLEIIKEHIEDNPSNSTRFLMLAPRPFDGVGDKCSLVFSTAHESGRLYKVLSLFAQAGVNLTRIASMPLREDPGNYNFFLDFEGSDRDEKIIALIDILSQESRQMRFLGSYPSGNRSL
jgi:prephenate dehydratase